MGRLVLRLALAFGLVAFAVSLFSALSAGVSAPAALPRAALGAIIAGGAGALVSFIFAAFFTGSS